MDWPGVIWAEPAFAWLFLLAIPAAWLLRRAAVRREHDLRRLAANSVPRWRPSWSLWAARLSAAAAALLLVVTLCRPQWGEVTLQQRSTGIDIVIALDVSRSMLADDVSPNRLVAAKRAVDALVPRLGGDRIGLIVFAGSAFLVCPLTGDYDNFSTALTDAVPDSMALGGSNLASALAEAQRAFTGAAERRRFLIVVSDGEDHGGDATAAATALRKGGVTVYGAAVGTSRGGLIPRPGGDFLRSGDGIIVKSRLQLAPLRALADAGGGDLLDLAQDPQALPKLYAAVLSAAQRVEIRTTRQQLAERFQIPLALALCLLLMGPLIAARARR